MKPADHPEFFRFAPPPGTSRESTIVLDRRGRFHHDGVLVEHPALERALRSWISAHPDDGRPILTNGYDWCYFRHEDAPMFVDAVAVSDAGEAVLKLFDGTEEPLDPAALSVGKDGVVYAKVRGGKLEARFTRHAQTGLAPLLQSAEPPVISAGGKVVEIPPRAV